MYNGLFDLIARRETIRNELQHEKAGMAPRIQNSMADEWATLEAN